MTSPERPDHFSRNRPLTPLGRLGAGRLGAGLRSRLPPLFEAQRWGAPKAAAPAEDLAREALPGKPPSALRLLTLNVAHGRRRMPNVAYRARRMAHRNLSEIAGTLRGVEADVVGLQEADGPSSWSGNFDHVATLADLAELDAHYRGGHNRLGRNRLRVDYGTALMARLELQNRRSYRFRANWRDTKGFVAATVEVPEWGGLEVDVVSVHLDFLVPTVRRRQIVDMVVELAACERPLVVLGDLNCCLEREPKSMELLLKTLDLQAHMPDSQAPTYPSYRPRRRFDWILISSQLEFAGYHTLPTRLSDHLGVVADLRPR